MLKVAEPVRFGFEESVAVTAKLVGVPAVAAVGVPLITPVVEFNPSPAGSVPGGTLKV